MLFLCAPRRFLQTPTHIGLFARFLDARLQFPYDAESDIPRLVAEVKRSRAERVALTRELDEAHASEASALERAEKAEAELARMKAERDALSASAVEYWRQGG